MRADRLVAALLVLQARTRVTAAELAEELEVSERTARRDLEALAMSGLPIYSQAGRGGGWTLLGGARTDLSGLTADEARALFLTVGTTATAGPALTSAVRKLVQALPEPFRGDAHRIADVAVIDEAAWGRPTRRRDSPWLEPLQRAVLTERQVELGYDGPGRGPTTRVVHPLGLVSKAGVWYLVSETTAGRRLFRLDRVTSVTTLDAPVERPDGFDLAQVWREITVRVQEQLHPVRVLALAEPTIVGPLRHVFGTRLQVGPRRAGGRLDVEIAGETASIVAAQLAGFGGVLEVLAPDEVRAELALVGARLVASYGRADDSA